LIGCQADEPLPHLDAIQPSSAYSDKDVRVTITGTGLMPSFRVDPSTDERVAIVEGFSGRIGKAPNWAPLTMFGWLGPEQITATLGHEAAEDLYRTPSDLPFDVEITDPRGRKAILLGGFTELGPDKEGPVITLTSPGSGRLYCPGGTLHVQADVADAVPGYLTSVTWSLNGTLPDRNLLNGHCPFEAGAAKANCAFDLSIDRELDPNEPIKLVVSATDNAKNTSSVESLVSLSEPPTVKSVVPNVSPTSGGTDVIITGTGFDSDSRAYFGDSLLYPNGGTVLERGTIISGYTPAHAEGEVTVKVVSRLGEVLLSKPFTYGDSSTGGKR
jgi:IPT/TIG domain